MPEDTDLEGRFRFRVGRRDHLVLYKRKGETADHVRLKAVAYAMFFREFENLQINPKLDFKIQPDLVSLNLEGEPDVWIQCDERKAGDIEYICKHTPAREVVLVTQDASTDDLIKRLKRHIHYRYAASKLKIVNFHDPVEDWMDPDQLEVPTGTYDVVDF